RQLLRIDLVRVPVVHEDVGRQTAEGVVALPADAAARLERQGEAELVDLLDERRTDDRRHLPADRVAPDRIEVPHAETVLEAVADVEVDALADCLARVDAASAHQRE